MKTFTFTESEAKHLADVIDLHLMETIVSTPERKAFLVSLVEQLRVDPRAMTDADWDNLDHIRFLIGRYFSSGSGGRLQLAHVQRLEHHGYVTIERPPVDKHRGVRPNRSWSAFLTEAGRQALAARNARKEEA